MPKINTNKYFTLNKRGLCSILVGLMSIGATNINAQTIQLYINDSIQSSGVSKLNEQDIMVPIREICDALGGEIYYKSVENKYYILIEERMLVVQIGNADVWIDGKEVHLHIPPQIINGKLCISARALVEYFEFNIMWDSTNNVLYINDKVQGSSSSLNTPTETPVLPEGTDTLPSTPPTETPSNPPSTDDSMNGSNSSNGSINLENIKYISSSNQIVITKKGNLQAANIKLVDDYMQRTLKLQFDADYSYMLGNLNTTTVNDDSLTSIVITNSGYTEIQLKTPVVKAATITEDHENIYIKLNKPKEVYDKIVVLDAGHGDHDPGAVGINGVTEKSLNLQILNETVKALDNKGVKMYLTRKDDTYITLEGRTKVANEVEADYFISIHNNSGSAIANGTEVLYYPTDEASKRFASVVQEKFVSTLGVTNRGIKPRSDLAVLRGSKMPAILIEAGFITNQKDYEMLINTDKQRQMGTIIADSILVMFN